MWIHSRIICPHVLSIVTKKNSKHNPNNKKHYRNALIKFLPTRNFGSTFFPPAIYHPNHERFCSFIFCKVSLLIGMCPYQHWQIFVNTCKSIGDGLFWSLLSNVHIQTVCYLLAHFADLFNSDYHSHCKPTLWFQEMIDEADRDGDGEINEGEFLRIMKKTSLYWETSYHSVLILYLFWTNFGSSFNLLVYCINYHCFSVNNVVLMAMIHRESPLPKSVLHNVPTYFHEIFM